MALMAQQLADKLGIKCIGDGARLIDKVSSLENAEVGSLAFLRDYKLQPYLSQADQSVVILPSEFATDYCGTALISENPTYHFARALKLLYPNKLPPREIHPSSSVSPLASIAESASIGPNVVIEDNAVIGEKVIIRANAFIGRSVNIGALTEVGVGAVIHHECQIGENGIIHSGVVIGDDGFGFAQHQGRWEKILQIGSVVIGDDVDIGANTTIDRGALGDTLIGDGVKLDNQIQIGHNVSIGKNTIIAAHSAIAGSAKIGENCMIGGAVSIAGHLEIVNSVNILGAAVVLSSIKNSGTYSSATPLEEVRAWRRNFNRFRQLDKFAKRLFKIEKNITN